MGKHFHHFTWTERLRIEFLFHHGETKTAIAKQLGFSRQAVSDEMKREQYISVDDCGYERLDYSPEIADRKYREYLKAKGSKLKIDNDFVFADFLEKEIVDNKRSPYSALEIAKEKNFSTTICVTTLYHYIDRGVFLRLGNESLPEKRKRKRKYKKVTRSARLPRGISIEQRPKEIEGRADFGHWEMDCVDGKQNTKAALLVLTERKTRFELIFFLKNKEAKTVIQTLDRLERKLGAKLFCKVFKSITVDNGSEFDNYNGLKKSCLQKQNRTEFYYCHPNNPQERGSNENANKLIRRHIPKGTPIETVPRKQLPIIERWVNTTPRKIHGGKTAENLFMAEVDKKTAKILCG